MTAAGKTHSNGKLHPPTLRDPNARTVARIAGIGYVLIFGLAIFANFFVRERLVDKTDPAATFANLAESQTMLRAAIAAFGAITIIEVVVAWALYYVFRPAGPAVAALSSGFRLVGNVFLGIALVFLFIVLRLVGGNTLHTGAIDQAVLETNTMLALESFNATWLIGLAAFGVHLILMGVLILRSQMARRWLGVVLAVAGAAYVFDTAAYTIYSGYEASADLFTAIVALPAIVAEAAFVWWLLARAGRTATSRSA